jgi:hypothetical protein
LSQRVANLLDTIFQRSPKEGDTVCDHFMCSYSCGESTTYGNGLSLKETLDWNRRNLELDSHEKKITLNEHVRKVGPNTDLERRMKR